jgi:precorrin-2 dehydrogenase / sirohydrochlorin ferrochelatase
VPTRLAWAFRFGENIMKYYPIFLDIKDKECLVVGGGPVGIRKAFILKKCGARVNLISNVFSEDMLLKLSGSGIRFETKEYDSLDINGMFLIFAATNSDELNRKIKKDAMDLNILCNVADSPDYSDFLVPSVVDKGELTVAISTSGASPALAKRIRKDLELYFDESYNLLLRLLRNIRKKLLSSGHAPDKHKQALNTLLDKNILELVRHEDETAINAVLCEVFGKTYVYQDLMACKE